MALVEHVAILLERILTTMDLATTMDASRAPMA